MAEISIRLIYNLDSGKKDIYIDLESDSDMLPIEHEDAHRDIIQNLIGQSVLTEDEAGEVVVRRVSPQSEGSPSQEIEQPPEQQSQSNFSLV